jgi:hypothetical protein
VCAVGRDLEGNPCALDATNLPARGEERRDLGGESSSAAPENERKHLCLAIVGALVDEDTGRTLHPPRPEVTFPSAHTDEGKVVEAHVAVVAALDVPEEDRLAEAIVRGFRERAGAGDGATTVVEPVSCDVPTRDGFHRPVYASA